jgi:hypothetical protein
MGSRDGRRWDAHPLERAHRRIPTLPRNVVQLIHDRAA